MIIESMVLRPRSFLIIFVIMNISWLVGARNNKITVINDLPNGADFYIFFPVLEGIVNFTSMNRGLINHNLAWSLNLVHENLKLLFTRRLITLTVPILTRLRNLREQNYENLQYYKQNSNDLAGFRNAIDLLLAPLILPQMTLNLLHETDWLNETELHKFYKQPRTYTKNLYYYNKGVPTPQLANNCLLEVLAYNYKETPLDGYCYIPENCTRMLTDGTEFGYFITHRLLFMKIAKLSVKCKVFSENFDTMLANRMCVKIFNEAEYIATNDFFLPDLLMEQMLLCALNGDLQFLRRSWLLRLIRYQSPDDGCMKLEIDEKKDATFRKLSDPSYRRIGTNKTDDSYKKCEVHMTAMAAALFATTIRYIVQTFFETDH